MGGEAVGAVFERVSFVIRDLEKSVEFLDVIGKMNEILPALEGKVVV